MKNHSARAKQKKETCHLHKFSAFGKTYIFDGFRLQTFRLGERALKVWQRFHNESAPPLQSLRTSDHDTAILKTLTDNKLIYPLYAPKPHFPKRKYKESINYIMLQIAEGCNLRCGYCFSNQGQYTNKDFKLMPFAVARASVEFLFDNCDEEVTPDICFFGGEPLLNFTLMQELVPYAKEMANKHNKKISFSITTNATLLNDSILEFITEHKIDMLVSIDGIGYENDINRKLPNGKGSFSLLQPTLKNLVHSQQCRARVTLAKGNLNIEKIVLDILKFGFSGVHVSMSTGRDLQALNANDLKKVMTGLDNLAEHYLQFAAQNIYFPFLTLHEELHNLRKNRILNQGCGAGRNFLTVMPDGNMYACTRSVGNDDPLWVGNVMTREINHSLREFFWLREVDKHPVCSRCWARYLCSGGCFAKNVAQSGGFDGVDETYCNYRQRTLELAIAIYFELKYLKIDPAFSTYNQDALKTVNINN